MSDHGSTTLREEPFDGAHNAVRDALPAFLHGRVSAAERAELDAHLAACAPCAAELRTLARVRDLYSAAPPIAVDRIAAAVRAATVPSPTAQLEPRRVEPVPVDAVTSVRPAPLAAGARRRAPAWARRPSLRALAATLVLAVGSGAVLVRGTASTATRRDSAAVHVAATARAAAGPASGVPSVARPAADPSGSLLGASFSDLSDSELAAVVAAVADSAAAAPSAEPASVLPDLSSGAE